ncbi:hypothetical protein V5799_015027, partial [Amblyomma americanum]
MEKLSVVFLWMKAQDAKSTLKVSEKTANSEVGGTALNTAKRCNRAPAPFYCVSLAGVSRCPGESVSPVSELAAHESFGGPPPARPQQQQQRQQRGHSRGGSFLGAVGSPAVIGSRMPPCPGDVQDNNGTVESPNFPDTYPPNTDCFTVIRVKPGDVVALKFETLFMERNPRCSSDYVEIFDGPSF